MNPTDFLAFCDLIGALFQERHDPEGQNEAYHRGTTDILEAFRAYGENHRNELAETAYLGDAA